MVALFEIDDLEREQKRVQEELSKATAADFSRTKENARRRFLTLYRFEIRQTMLELSWRISLRTGQRARALDLFVRDTDTEDIPDDVIFRAISLLNDARKQLL